MSKTIKTKAITYVCKGCHNKGIWNGLPLKHDVDHMSRDIKNQKLSNVQLLCPNCYSVLEKKRKNLS